MTNSQKPGGRGSSWRWYLGLSAVMAVAFAVLMLVMSGSGGGGPPDAGQPVSSGQLDDIAAGDDSVALDDAADPGAPSSVDPQQTTYTGTIDELFEGVDQSAPGFGGMFYDEQGRLNVYLQDPAQAEAAEAAIAASFGADRIPEGGINVLVGEYSSSQLNDWHNRMSLDVLAMPGVVFTDVDEGVNRLRVGVEDLALVSAVEERLAALDVPRAAVEIEQAEPIMAATGPTATPIAGNKTLRDKIRPLIGGLELDDGNCTLGFIAKLGNQTGFVTNSHCTLKMGVVDGGVFSQSKPADKVGVEAKDPPFFDCLPSSKGTATPTPPAPPTPLPAPQLCRHSDSAFVHLNPGVQAGLGFIAKTNAINSLNINIAKSVYRIVEIKQPVVGDKVNKVGRTSGTSQGAVSAVCQNLKVGYEEGPKVILCSDQVAASAGGGDSGSPVFAVIGSGNDVRLYGILHSGPPDDKSFNFSNMGQVQRDLGPLTVVDPKATPVKPATPVPTKNPGQQVFQFFNNTTGTASDLRVVFSGAVLSAKLLRQPGVCPLPTITLATISIAKPTPTPPNVVANNTVNVVWPAKCVQKGQEVRLGVTSVKKPLKVVSVTWTNQGTAIPTQTPTPTATPDPLAAPKQQDFMFFNNTTGPAANGLEVTFNATAVLLFAKIINQPPACGVATFSLPSPNVLRTVWPAKCIPKGQRVTIGVRANKNPLKVVSVRWTNDPGGGNPTVVLPTQTPQPPMPTKTPVVTPTRTPKTIPPVPPTWTPGGTVVPTQTAKPTPAGKVTICLTAIRVGVKGQEFWTPAQISNHIAQSNTDWAPANINFTWDNVTYDVADPVPPPPGEDGDLIQSQNEDDRLVNYRGTTGCFPVFFINKLIDKAGNWTGTTGLTTPKGYFGQTPPKLGRYIVIDSKANKILTTLAHELGHALCLAHVGSDPNNLMYYAKGRTGDNLTPGQIDVARGCGENLRQQLASHLTATPTPKNTMTPLPTATRTLTPTPAATKTPQPTPKLEQVFKFVNNTTGKASSLTVVFNASLEPGFEAFFPAACGDPIVLGSKTTTVADDTVNLVWPKKCVQKGQLVRLIVQSQKIPLSVLSYTWMQANPGGCEKTDQDVVYQSKLWDLWKCAPQTPPPTTPTPAPFQFNRIEISVGKATQTFKLNPDSPPRFVCQATGEKAIGAFKIHLKDVNPDPLLPNHEVWSANFMQKCQGSVDVYLQPLDPDNHPVIKEVFFRNTTPLPTQTPTPTPTRTRTPTPTPTTQKTPVVVGGISFHPPGGGGHGSSGFGDWYVAAAMSASALALASLGGAAWYARRRKVR